MVEVVCVYSNTLGNSLRANVMNVLSNIRKICILYCLPNSSSIIATEY